MKSKSTVVARVAAQRAAMTARRRMNFSLRLVKYRSKFSVTGDVSPRIRTLSEKIQDLSATRTEESVQQELQAAFRSAQFTKCALLGFSPMRQPTEVTPGDRSCGLPALLRTKRTELVLSTLTSNDVCDGWCKAGTSCISCFPDLYSLKNYGGTE